MQGTIKTTKTESQQPQVEDFEMSEHQQALMQQELEENQKLQSIVDLMAMSSPNNHPSVLDVKNWKSKYGKIYMSSVVEDTEVYVWRPILRQEWKAILGAGYTDDMLRQEALLETCLLFPKKDTILYERPAGVISALETKIMFQSGFVSSEYLLSSIREIN